MFQKRVLKFVLNKKNSLEFRVKSRVKGVNYVFENLGRDNIGATSNLFDHDRESMARQWL